MIKYEEKEDKTNGGKKKGFKTFFAIALIVGFAVATVILGLLYLSATKVKFIVENKGIITAAFLSITIISAVLSAVFLLINYKIIYKLLLIFLGLLTAFLGAVYIVQITGLWDKIDSVEDLREYVASYGKFTIPAFIILQFLQVTVLPLPGMITTMAGVALFGSFFGALYSFIGITSASFVAFFIGRKLGYKVASWLVGKESLEKWLKVVKNKDKVVLTFMFVFPFFPDDILCFVAGLSSMSVTYYSIMIIITRLLSVYITSYSVSGYIIPYDTWWGILIWIIVFILTALLCVFIYKKGDKIERYFKEKFGKKNERKDDITR